MSKPGSSTIFLLRHGEPVGGPRYRGSTDDVLSELGWQQMHSAVASYQDWQFVVSSPLLRCYDFAKRLSGSLDIPVYSENRFAEINFGDWENKSGEELWQHDRVNYENYLSDPLLYTPPNGETLSQFSLRVLSAWESLITSLHAQDTILLVAHGGTIRVILQHILGMPLQSIMKIHTPYACMSKILIDYTKNQLPVCRLGQHN